MTPCELAEAAATLADELFVNPVESDNLIAAALARAHAEGKAEGLAQAAGEAFAASREYRNKESISGESACKQVAARIRSLIPAAPGGGGK